MTFPALLEANFEVAKDPHRKAFPWKCDVRGGIMNLRARGPEAGLGVKAVASRPDSPECCVLRWAASSLSKGNLPGLK